MIRTSLFVLALLPGLAHAVICKIVDPVDGVTYTDVPLAECPQEVQLPDYSRYAPRPIDQPQSGRGAADAQGSVLRFERYRTMKIVQPSPAGVVRSNEGQVSVVIDLQPALQTGHRISLTLDGRAVAGAFDGPAIVLSGIDRGTHSLRAFVSDQTGRQLISSAPVRFTLRKLGLTDSNADAEKPTPPPTPDPGYPASDTPADYTPPASPGYAPSESPDYTPKGAPISSTPGKTNPAFAPKYTP